MSPNAIIEGLKQGNAIELGVLRDVKEGMNAVVDGMINECLNRSDGLSDLMEKVRLQESSSAATAEQKIQLTKVIKDAIENCKQAMSLNDRKKEREYNRASLAFEAEKRLLNMVKSHGGAQLAVHKQRSELCKNMFMYLLFESEFETQLEGSLYNLRIEEYGLIRQLAGFERDARRGTNDRKSRWYRQIEKACEKEKRVLEKQIASLERIAVIAEIDLKDA